jgi:hypothetical protein
VKRNRASAAVNLGPDVQEKLAGLAQAALPLETGGILLGWYNDADIQVVDAIVVDDPCATATSYHRGREQGNEALAAFLNSQGVGSPVGYVGEWHSHTGAVGPSALDAFSFASITRAAKRPLVLVVMALDTDHWEPFVRVSQLVGRFRRTRA